MGGGTRWVGQKNYFGIKFFSYFCNGLQKVCYPLWIDTVMYCRREEEACDHDNTNPPYETGKTVSLELSSRNQSRMVIKQDMAESPS